MRLSVRCWDRIVPTDLVRDVYASPPTEWLLAAGGMAMTRMSFTPDSFVAFYGSVYPAFRLPEPVAYNENSIWAEYFYDVPNDLFPYLASLYLPNPSIKLIRKVPVPA